MLSKIHEAMYLAPQNIACCILQHISSELIRGTESKTLKSENHDHENVVLQID